jgi:hypothetical protein
VGSTEGAAVGSTDGVALGSTDGAALGSTDGAALVGAEDGKSSCSEGFMMIELVLVFAKLSEDVVTAVSVCANVADSSNAITSNSHFTEGDKRNKTQHE